MTSKQPPEDPARAHMLGLRRVAVASVAALALVLSLAVATAGHHQSAHGGNSGYGAPHGQRAGRAGEVPRDTD